MVPWKACYKLLVLGLFTSYFVHLLSLQVWDRRRKTEALSYISYTCFIYKYMARAEVESKRDSWEMHPAFDPQRERSSASSKGYSSLLSNGCLLFFFTFRPFSFSLKHSLKSQEAHSSKPDGHSKNYQRTLTFLLICGMGDSETYYIMIKSTYFPLKTEILTSS